MAANRHWTDSEVSRLRWGWGYHSIRKLAKELNRTPTAVARKAKDLKLGPPSKKGMSLRAFERYSGFSHLKIMQAARKLRIVLPKAFSGDASRGNIDKAHQYVIDIDLQEQLLEVMLNNERIYADNKGSRRTTRGKWGVGKKPKACVDCGRATKPHYAKGKCAPCYNRRYSETKARAKMWGVGGRPDGCIRCGRSDVQHYAKKMCSGCYRKQKKEEEDNARDTVVGPTHQEQP